MFARQGYRAKGKVMKISFTMIWLQDLEFRRRLHRRFVIIEYDFCAEYYMSSSDSMCTGQVGHVAWIIPTEPIFLSSDHICWKFLTILPGTLASKVMEPKSFNPPRRIAICGYDDWHIKKFHWCHNSRQRRTWTCSSFRSFGNRLTISVVVSPSLPNSKNSTLSDDPTAWSSWPQRHSIVEEEAKMTSTLANEMW